MRIATALLALLFTGRLLAAQAALAKPSAEPALRPTPAEVQAAMGMPSQGERRGQLDTVGYATTVRQMAQVWAASAQAPGPEGFGPLPSAGVAGLICPHDDYLYAGRVYRRILPLVTARTVIIVGVFHKYRRFGARNQLVFDHHRTWRAPDGDIPISALQADLMAQLPVGDQVQDASMHEAEHSVEAIAYWLKHQNPAVEIVPVLVPAASFERLRELAVHLGQALALSLRQRQWALGRDLAVVISSDGIHYGADFNHTPHGAGGVTAYLEALAEDRKLLQGPLSGPISAGKAEAFFGAVVDPAHPDTYRRSWCGRFSVPFGLLLVGETARSLGLAAPVGHPVAFGSSLSFPQLKVRESGLGVTAEANLFHFVTYPGVAFTLLPN